jgi:hypothetical protein
MSQIPISNPFDEDERANRRPILWAMLGLAAVCCVVTFAAAIFYFQPDVKSLYAQYFPSPTLTPSQTPTFTPTNTAVPTYTLTPTASSTPTPNMTATAQVQNANSTAESASNNWKVIISEPFDSNKNKWLVLADSEDEYATTTYEITNGKYRWDTTAHKSHIGWVRAGKKPLTDFYLSVEIQAVEAPDSADYGVVFREDENSNFYYFGINGQGKYILYVFFEEWDTLIDWTESEFIEPGELNRITVIGEGSHFTFFVNDQYLTEFTDDKIPEGVTALAVELSVENDHAVFEFDNFELRAP